MDSPPVDERSVVNELDDVVALGRHPVASPRYQAECRRRLDDTGVVVLDRFLLPRAVDRLVEEAAVVRPLAFFSHQTHSVYLTPPDSDLPRSDARSWAITSTKGAVTADLVPDASPLRALYTSPPFKRFLCAVLGEAELYPYADPLSSININYFEAGQQLGWHFDDSAFAVTLLLQRPEGGGHFEFVPGMRRSAIDDDNESGVAVALGGAVEPTVLTVDAGDLVLFRGRDALHRVTPVEGSTPRILVVLAYNREPRLELSAAARMTFFGRLE